ncbi:unnamed protein product [Darwinula stevensoni]|uniref:Uncharacterized protein n=1 Tax=Darwinula stevensoni TaxID=69355 RepID=A0A7R9A0F9_9CRUS|nr:unnamed protein product [Darwinula stevensoni]CAG0885508.1 unnamed protein product [Darwinula stevensoni]
MRAIHLCPSVLRGAKKKGSTIASPPESDSVRRRPPPRDTVITVTRVESCEIGRPDEVVSSDPSRPTHGMGIHKKRNKSPLPLRKKSPEVDTTTLATMTTNATNVTNHGSHPQGKLPRTLSTSVLRVKTRSTFWERFWPERYGRQG